MAEQVYIFPTTFAQRRLWFLRQLEPDSPFYNIPGAFRVKGHLDEEAVRAALDEIARRHEAMRTTFALVDGNPVQVVAPCGAVPFDIIDLRGHPDEIREGEAAAIVTAASRRPFNLEDGPLLRAGVLRLGAEDRVLYLIMDHIISDGWSVGVLVREMMALYESLRSGRQASLPELPIQYGDFAVWQREQFQGEVLEEQLAYWRRQLRGDQPLLELPINRPRPPVETHRGAQQRVLIGRALTEGLQALARSEEATIFIALTAALGTLLSRYSGQDDLTIGTTVANRRPEETEVLIGCFVNTLVLRIDLAGNPSFRDLLRRVQKVAWEAYANQDVPFERLVEELHPVRDLSQPALFQSMLSLNNVPMPTFSLPGLTLEPLEIDRGTALFDLLFLLEESQGEIGGVLQYNTDLFDGATISRLTGHFERLIASAIREPDLPVSRLAILSEAEQQQLLFEWNATAHPYPRECVHHMIEACAGNLPDKVAVISSNQHISYGELNSRADRLAQYLSLLGVGPDGLVGICLERSIELIVAMLATMKAGGAYIPLDPQYPKERLAFMLEDAQALVLLTKEEMIESLGEQPAKIVAVDSEWDEIARLADEHPYRQDATPENLAYVIYTSGSTGNPKGSMIEHRSLANYIRTAAGAYGVSRDDRVLQFCSISFDISAEEIYPCLTSGGTLIFRNDEMLESVPRFLGTCESWGVSMLSLPTAYWHEITAALDKGVESLPSAFRLVIIAGERALPERLDVWRAKVRGRVRLINTYGLTESTIISTIGELTGSEPDPFGREVSIGKVIRNTQIYLTDRYMKPVPIWVAGEIYIGGELLARGYNRQPALTAERFVPDPFGPPGSRLYKTGDSARYRSDGELEFLGRMDGQIKIRGYRVELGEIESALRKHEAIRDAVVVPDGLSKATARLVAYIVPKEGVELASNEVRSFLRTRLPEYMVPSVLLTIAALPLTPNGKVDRKALPPVEALRAETEILYVPPRNELEQVVARVWQEVLQVEQVGMHDNFFELGGHSLLLIQLRGKLAEALARPISMIELFQYPTIDSYARYLSNEASDEAAAPADTEAAVDRRLAKKRRRSRRQTAAVADLAESGLRADGQLELPN
jgi:amino acid adenylation domain-containing protein